MNRPEPATVHAAGPIERTDIDAARQLASQRHHPAVRLAAALAQVGDQPPLLAIAAVVTAGGLLARNRRVARSGGHMLASVLIASAVKAALKRAVSRTRPNMLLDQGVYAVEPLGPDAGPWHSFPSGHTAGAVAMARACGSAWPAARLPAYAGAAAVGAAQLVSGAHFPVDVAAGVLIGVVAQAVAERVLPPW